MKEIFVSNESLYGKFLHRDITIGEDIFKIGTELNETIVSKIIEAEIKSIEISNSRISEFLETGKDNIQTKSMAVNDKIFWE